jgi:NAD(P)-dependent dehydrogenase (short-subunit alcohol dehydrogenase family)
MKGAREVRSKHIALELRPRRIAVNVVAPGPGRVATDFSGGIVRDNPEMNKRNADNTALGRSGVPKDLGLMIASLLSEDNHWPNAQRIEVAGGVAIQPAPEFCAHSMNRLRSAFAARSPM